MSFSVEVNARNVLKGLNFYVKALPERLDEGVSRAAFEVGREMADHAPKAHSTLVSSIKPDQVALMEWRVGPHVNYAADVEYGTEGGGFVPFDVLFSWIKIKGIQPQNPEWTLEDLTVAIQDKILAKGTPAQPFAKPVVDSGFAEEALMRNLLKKARQAKQEAGL